MLRYSRVIATWDTEPFKAITTSTGEQTFTLDNARGAVSSMLMLARDITDVSDSARPARNSFNFKKLSTIAMDRDSEKLMLEQTGDFNRVFSTQAHYSAPLTANVYSLIPAHAPQSTASQTGYLMANTARTLTVKLTKDSGWTSAGRLDVLSQRVNTYSLDGASRRFIVHHG